MWMCPELSFSTISGLMSTHVTVLPVSARHVPVTRPTYPVPTTATFTMRTPCPWGESGGLRGLRKDFGNRYADAIQGHRARPGQVGLTPARNSARAPSNQSLLLCVRLERHDRLEPPRVHPPKELRGD